MLWINKKIFLYIFLLSVLLSPLLVFAQYGMEVTAKGTIISENFKGGSLQALLGSILGMFLAFVGILFFVLVVYAGITWMTSAGNEEKVNKSKSIIIAATIGMIITFGSYSLVKLLFFTVGDYTSAPTNTTGKKDNCCLTEYANGTKGTSFDQTSLGCRETACVGDTACKIIESRYVEKKDICNADLFKKPTTGCVARSSGQLAIICDTASTPEGCRNVDVCEYKNNKCVPKQNDEEFCNGQNSNNCLTFNNICKQKEPEN